MGRFRTRLLPLVGVVILLLSVVLRVTAKRPMPPRGAPGPTRDSAGAPLPPVSDAVAPVLPNEGPRAAKRYAANKGRRVRPSVLLLSGVTCVILGAALYSFSQLALPPDSVADQTKASAGSSVDAPAGGDAASPATDSAGMSPTSTAAAGSGFPAVTLTTSAPAALGGRLAHIAASAGFTILGLKAPGWKLAAVDTEARGEGSFAAVSYVRGTDYATITQEKATTSPTLSGAQFTTIRGQAGTLTVMNPLVSLRWQEEGVAMLLTTNLPRDAALALTDRLEPVP